MMVKKLVNNMQPRGKTNGYVQGIIGMSSLVTLSRARKRYSYLALSRCFPFHLFQLGYVQLDTQPISDRRQNMCGMLLSSRYSELPQYFILFI